MSILMLGVLVIGIFCVSYRIYGAKIEKVYGIDPHRKTPAVEYYDGVDYVPARHWFILFGHHFAAIAGAAPIIGPIIAVSIWGWGPSLIWIVLGCILMGAVHDFGALLASVRHKGWSVAEIGGIVIGERTRVLFSVFIWLALILVVAVFVFFSAQTYVVDPKVVVPSFGLIPVAMLVGFMLYTLRLNQWITTLIGLALLIGLMFLGEKMPITLGEKSLVIWIVALLVYCYVASVIPVQILLQPRDYLCGLLLAVGVLSGYGGIVLTRPNIGLPFYVSWEGKGGTVWPMLFVTIACGAISGFHALVSSGTSSKQLPSEKDAKKIGFGGMLMEGGVAVLALLAILAGFKDQGALTQILAQDGPGPIAAFREGYKIITTPLFGAFGGIIAVTILNSFILSSLDAATRIGRYITQELFGTSNRYAATLIVVLASAILALTGKWEQIWPIFGASNQLVAALALLVITTWLIGQKRPIFYTLIPAVFVLVTTVGALVYNAILFFKGNNYLLLGIDLVLIVLAFFVSKETVGVMKRRRVSLGTEK